MNSLDSRYFKEKLGQLVRDADNYRPDEMARALFRYASLADKEVIREPEFKRLREDVNLVNTPRTEAEAKAILEIAQKRLAELENEDVVIENGLRGGL